MCTERRGRELHKNTDPSPITKSVFFISLLGSLSVYDFTVFSKDVFFNRIVRFVNRTSSCTNSGGSDLDGMRNESSQVCDEVSWRTLPGVRIPPTLFPPKGFTSGESKEGIRRSGQSLTTRGSLPLGFPFTLVSGKRERESLRLSSDGMVNPPWGSIRRGRRDPEVLIRERLSHPMTKSVP